MGGSLMISATLTVAGRENTSRGVPNCTIAPSMMTATWSATDSPSLPSGVVQMQGRPSEVSHRRSSPRSQWRSLASR
jgi:hypothetical protein